MSDPYRELTEDAVNQSPEKIEVIGKPSESTGRLTEILELQKKLVEKKAALAPEEEKTLEEIIGQEQKQGGRALSGGQAPSVVSSGLLPTPAVIKEEAEKLRGVEKNQQLKSLIDLAFEKNVIYATEIARNLDNPYLLDEFHDTLIDKLYQELLDKGKIEEI